MHHAEAELFATVDSRRSAPYVCQNTAINEGPGRACLPGSVSSSLSSSAFHSSTGQWPLNILVNQGHLLCAKTSSPARPPRTDGGLGSGSRGLISQTRQMA